MAKRKCQTGRVRTVLVEDFDPPVKLFVRTTFGRLVQLTEEIKAVPDDDQSGSLPVVRNFLLEAVTGWEGVVDEDDNPRSFSAEALDDLETEDVMTFLQAVQGMGEAGSGDPLAETASTEGSPEQPGP